MLKSIKRALIAAAVLTLLGLGINYISFLTGGKLLLSRTIYGGEWIGELGFGLLLNHVYPMLAEGYSYPVNNIWIEFDLSNFILTFVIIAVVTFAVSEILRHIKKNKA